MSVLLAVLLLVTAHNPPRRRAELTNRPQVILAGGALTLAVLVILGGAGDSILDALDISAPTLRVAVGLVLAARGLLDLARRLPVPGDGLDGMKGAIVPVFFPVLLRPELALAAVSVAVDGGLGAMTFGAAVALGLVPAVPRRYCRVLSVVASTLLVALAVDRIIDGVFAL